ncbi:hypothetical protein M407DRAFT_25154 [Tulasnella calospora MUT 4182]|uniref:Uncharacterized protein n=1 Tax=Tulasnella calospora MUT 4182 TaxID=1051891 RepID=A0A0C3LVZ5_9AGAM|nr:hypothetical protein M407DRAFT_25154 [Tulasnella calospora MUT 4182]
MRLQYAKLKVDHGWSRQNLDEVENLYFHHYRDRRPEPSHQQPKAPQRRIGAAPFPSSSTGASTSHVQVEVSEPSGSQTRPAQPTSPTQATPRSTLKTQPTIVVDGAQENPGPLPIGYDPSVYSVGLNTPSSSLQPQSSTSTLATRTTSSPHPVVRTSHQGSRSHPYAFPPNATASSSGSVPISPQKISAKKAGKAPVRGSTGAGNKSLGKTSSKTSIPSTLQSPQIAESTAAARLAQMMGTKTGPGPVGSASVAVPVPSSLAGPTSYESFWNQLGTGGLGARTLLSTSPSRSRLGSMSAGASLSAKSSSTLKNGFSPTSSFGPSASTSGSLLLPQPISSPTAPSPIGQNAPSSADTSSNSTSAVPYHSLFRALQVTPEQLAASDARLNGATSQAQIGSFNPPAAAFVMSGPRVHDRLPPATQSNPA